MKQKVITPDCPRCHGALWSVPCPHGGNCEHFECTECGVEWVHHSYDGWVRYDDRGQVLETIPPRVPRFRRAR